MNTLYLALKSLWRNKVVNILIIVQIVVSASYLVPLLSEVLYFSSAKEAVDSVLTDKSYYLHVTTTAFERDKQLYEDFVVRTTSSEYVESVGEVYSIFSDCTDYDLFIYNESLIRYFRPNLAKGVWFSDYTPSKSGVTPIVVAADSIYELGDSFPLELYYLVEGDRLTMHTEAFVIGVIAAPVQYATLSKGADEIYFQSDFLFNQSSEVIILPNTREIDNFLGDRKYELASMGKLLYLREDVDVSIVKGDFGYYGVVSDLSKGKSQFYHSVYMGLLREALYFSTYFLITVSCIMCINLIQNKDNKRRFTIYYLLGMDAKRGVMIETVRLFLMTALSVGATILFLLTQPFLLNEFTPSQRPFAILALLVYLAIVFLPISIVFVINTARHNIVDTLKDLFWDR